MSERSGNHTGFRNQQRAETKWSEPRNGSVSTSRKPRRCCRVRQNPAVLRFSPHKPAAVRAVELGIKCSARRLYQRPFSLTHFAWVSKTGVGLKGMSRFAPGRLTGAASAPAQRLPVPPGWRIRRCRASHPVRSDVAAPVQPRPFGTNPAPIPARRIRRAAPACRSVGAFTRTQYIDIIDFCHEDNTRDNQAPQSAHPGRRCPHRCLAKVVSDTEYQINRAKTGHPRVSDWSGWNKVPLTGVAHATPRAGAGPCGEGLNRGNRLRPFRSEAALPTRDWEGQSAGPLVLERNPKSGNRFSE